MATVTVTQFADALGINRRTVHRWARTGRVRAVKTPGGHWRIDARDLERSQLTTAEFARLVGVCQRTALRWIASGKVQAVQTPGGYLVAASDAARFAASRTPASTRGSAS